MGFREMRVPDPRRENQGARARTGGMPAAAPGEFNVQLNALEGMRGRVISQREALSAAHGGLDRTFEGH